MNKIATTCAALIAASAAVAPAFSHERRGHESYTAGEPGDSTSRITRPTTTSNRRGRTKGAYS
jgi:hypothetical protein